jgi:cytochrome c oxidase subunit 4
MRRRPPAALLWSWVGLMALLGLTVAAAYQPLGSFNTAAALAIATIKVLIIAAIFMELRAARSLTIAFAAAGLFWLFILMWLGSADFISRPEFPPTGPTVNKTFRGHSSAPSVLMSPDTESPLSLRNTALASAILNHHTFRNPT